MGLRFDRKDITTNIAILRRDALGIIGVAIAVLFIGTTIAVTIFGNRVVPFDPNAINLMDAFAPLSWLHPFGTDELGRDVFSRAIVATPIDAEIALAIVGGSIVVGLVTGSVAGFFGGRVDEILMRITDLFLAFPSLILAIAIAVALGPGVDHVIEANLVAWWPIYARLARTGALSLRETEFADAARAAGLSRFSIIRKHIFPNNISPLMVYATLDVGNAILYASVLSYLGLGAQPPLSEWGALVYDGQSYLGSAWWIAIMPGIVLFVVALGFNLFGDSLRDILDPRYRR